MVTSADREVLIRFKYELDRGAAKKVLGEMAGDAQKAQKAAEGSRDAVKQQAAEAKKAEQALEKLRRAHQQQVDRITGANEKMAESYKQMLGGIASVGRGVALLGLLGERDSQKLLRGLIKIQAAFDVMRGSIETVQGLTRVWQAYRVAVTAAAAAQGTLAAAQAASAATGTAAAAAAAGGRVAGGLGGAAARGGTQIIGSQVIIAGAGGAAGQIGGAAIPRLGGTVAAGGVGAGGAAGAAKLAAIPGVGGAAFTTGLAGTAIASAAIAGNVTIGTLEDIERFGFGGGAAPGTFRAEVAGGLAGAGAFASDIIAGRQGGRLRAGGRGFRGEALNLALLAGRGGLGTVADVFGFLPERAGAAIERQGGRIAGGLSEVQRQQQRGAAIAGIRGQFGALQRQGRARGVAGGLAELQAARAGVSGFPEERALNQIERQEAATADQRHLEALRNFGALKNQELQTEKQIAQEQLRADQGREQRARGRLAGLRGRQEGILGAERGRIQAIGALDPGGRARLRRVLGAVQGGGFVSPDDEAFALSFGGRDVRQTIERRRQIRGEEFADPGGVRQDLAAGEALIRRENRVIGRARELQRENQANIDSAADALAEEISKLLDERNEVLLRTMNRAIEAAEGRAAAAAAVRGDQAANAMGSFGGQV